jgi:acyl-CoA thioesterase FadM
MARVKLALPKEFPFSTEMPVRITDINYGGHVGNDAVLSLMHEARVRFLEAHGLTEEDVGGCGLTMIDAVIVYKAQAFHGDVLRIEVAADDISETSFDLSYRLTNKETGQEVARGKTGMAFYDYRAKKLVQAPEAFKSVFQVT